MIRLLPSWLLLAFVLILAPAGTAAATPEADVTVLAAADCTIAPRSFAELEALMASPSAAALATAEVGFRAVAEVVRLDRAGFELPAGDPVAPTTAAAVSPVVEEFYACLAAEDLGAVTAFFTDSWLLGISQVTFGPPASPTTASPTVIPTVTPLPPGPTPTPAAPGTARDIQPGDSLAVCDLRQLSAEFVGVTAVITAATPEQPVRVDFLVLVEVDGRWRIAAALDRMPARSGCDATAAANLPAAALLTNRCYAGRAGLWRWRTCSRTRNTG